MNGNIQSEQITYDRSHVGEYNERFRRDGRYDRRTGRWTQRPARRGPGAVAR